METVKDRGKKTSSYAERHLLLHSDSVSMSDACVTLYVLKPILLVVSDLIYYIVLI
jgi:hypothetical protein